MMLTFQWSILRSQRLKRAIVSICKMLVTSVLQVTNFVAGACCSRCRKSGRRTLLAKRRDQSNIAGHDYEGCVATLSLVSSCYATSRGPSGRILRLKSAIRACRRGPVRRLLSATSLRCPTTQFTLQRLLERSNSSRTRFVRFARSSRMMPRCRSLLATEKRLPVRLMKFRLLRFAIV